MKYKYIIIVLILIAALFVSFMLMQRSSQTQPGIPVPPLGQSPTNATAYTINKEGMDLAREGKFDSALVRFQEAISLDPSYVEAYNNMGATFNQLKQFEKADSILNIALNLRPEYPGGLFNLGRTYFYQKKYDEAMEVTKKALSIDSLDPGGYILLGDCYDRKGEFAVSESLYRKSLGIAENGHTYWKLGIALVSQRKYKEGVEVIQKSIQLVPNNADAHNNLGVALAALERYEQAIIAFKKAIELRPDYASAHINLGLSYENLGDHQKAADQLELYVKYASEEAPGLDFIKGKIKELREQKNE